MGLLRRGRDRVQERSFVRPTHREGIAHGRAAVAGAEARAGSFLDRFAPLFGRDENQGHARRFVQGLLLGGERRSVENIAEAIDGRRRPLPPGVHHHRRLAATPRSSASCAGTCRRCWATTTPSGTPTRPGSPRRGPSRSASSGSTPAPWAGPTTARSACSPTTARPRGTPSSTGGCSCPRSGPATATAASEAGVPEGVIFRTKPELALAMVADAVGRGGAVPVGRRRQRLRGQPDVRAGRPAAGQVVRAGHLGRRPGVDRPSRRSSRPSSGPGRARAPVHPAAGRRRAGAGRRGGRRLAGRRRGVG